MVIYYIYFQIFDFEGTYKGGKKWGRGGRRHVFFLQEGGKKGGIE
jgi:hypothetical protein